MPGHYERHVFVCVNQKNNGKKCCAEGGGLEAGSHLKKALVEKGYHGKGAVRVTQSGCLGRCAKGPGLVVYPEGVWYTYQTLADIDEIIEQHLLNGRKVTRLLMKED